MFGNKSKKSFPRSAMNATGLDNPAARLVLGLGNSHQYIQLSLQYQNEINQLHT